MALNRGSTNHVTLVNVTTTVVHCLYTITPGVKRPTFTALKWEVAIHMGKINIYLKTIPNELPNLLILKILYCDSTLSKCIKRTFTSPKSMCCLLHLFIDDT